MPWSFDPSVAALWLDLFWVVSENRQQGSSRGADFGRDGGKKSNSLHPAIARHFCPTLPSPFYRTGSRCSGRINECLLQGHHLVSACLGLSPSVTGLCPAPVRPLSQKGEPSAQRRAKQHADRSTHPWSRGSQSRGAPVLRAAEAVSVPRDMQGIGVLPDSSASECESEVHGSTKGREAAPTQVPS